MSQIRTTTLSPARRRFLRLMSEMGFGRIEGLRIQSGDPVLEPPPRIFRTIKLDEDQRTGSVPAGNDYAVRKQVVELLACFDRLRNETVASLEVQHGLPFRVTLEGADDLSPAATTQMNGEAV